jgi:hypothetical protein
MVRLLMLASLILIVILQYFDQAIFRSLTTLKIVEAVYVNDATIKNLVIETQEVINKESVHKFSEDAIVTIFNYRPGQADLHIANEDIKSLFITIERYEKFAEQFNTWSEYEFNVNNISIKETISSEGKLVRSPSPMASGGARLWRYRSKMPTLDRGVGGNVLSPLYVVVDMVYLGAKGGMGIYAIKLSS